MPDYPKEVTLEEAGCLEEDIKVHPFFQDIDDSRNVSGEIDDEEKPYYTHGNFTGTGRTGDSEPGREGFWDEIEVSLFYASDGKTAYREDALFNLEHLYYDGTTSHTLFEFHFIISFDQAKQLLENGPQFGEYQLVKRGRTEYVSYKPVWEKRT